MDTLYRQRGKTERKSTLTAAGWEAARTTKTALICFNWSVSRGWQNQTQIPFTFCDRDGQKLIVLADLTVAPPRVPPCSSRSYNGHNLDSAYEEKDTQTALNSGSQTSVVVSFLPLGDTGTKFLHCTESQEKRRSWLAVPLEQPAQSTGDSRRSPSSIYLRVVAATKVSTLERCWVILSNVSKILSLNFFSLVHLQICADTTARSICKPYISITFRKLIQTEGSITIHPS